MKKDIGNLTQNISFNILCWISRQWSRPKIVMIKSSVGCQSLVLVKYQKLVQ